MMAGPNVVSSKVQSNRDFSTVTTSTSRLGLASNALARFSGSWSMSFAEMASRNLREAVFLATWALDHVIETNPGGVAGPIRIAVFERDASGAYQPRTLPETEIAEHQQAVESAEAALRQWRDEKQSGRAAEGAPRPPSAPDGAS
jgi:hypothetical protein